MRISVICRARSSLTKDRHITVLIHNSSNSLSKYLKFKMKKKTTTEMTCKVKQRDRLRYAPRSNYNVKLPTVKERKKYIHAIAHLFQLCMCVCVCDVNRLLLKAVLLFQKLHMTLCNICKCRLCEFLNW